MSNPTPITKIKDPDEDLDYTWDLAELLEDDDESIVDYEFVGVPDDIELHDETAGATEVTAFVGPGGSVGDEVIITCRVTTDATPPRIYDRSIRFKLQTK